MFDRWASLLGLRAQDFEAGRAFCSWGTVGAGASFLAVDAPPARQHKTRSIPPQEENKKHASTSPSSRPSNGGKQLLHTADPTAKGLRSGVAFRTNIRLACGKSVLACWRARLCSGIKVPCMFAFGALCKRIFCGQLLRGASSYVSNMSWSHVGPLGVVLACVCKTLYNMSTLSEVLATSWQDLPGTVFHFKHNGKGEDSLSIFKTSTHMETCKFLLNSAKI